MGLVQLEINPPEKQNLFHEPTADRLLTFKVSLNV